MKDYEIVLTYLNGCAGAAYPQNSFEEARLNCPEDYIREKHARGLEGFVKEVLPGGQVVFTYRNGAATYIYEFTEI